MKLTVREIHKSQAIYKAIIELDDQIINLDKRAMVLANNTQSVNVSFDFEVKKQVEEIEADELHASFNKIMIGYMSPFAVMGHAPKKDTISFVVSDTEALTLIGCLINIKKIERQKLITELVELGFEFK